ncbi:MAG TPA: 1-deoxy-D-xylulose-5-phosphate reductoisomerase [Bacteroidetes bacterium]|nr:1-deoxy-D-xylulose-5-phosphate reductoisomerase [Bacteroidota bacterium]
MKKIAIFGASGSIGKNTLDVISRLPDEFRITCMSVHTSVDFLLQQALKLRPEAVIVTGENAPQGSIERLKENGISVFLGADGLQQAVKSVDFDILLNALVGAAGLLPTLLAVEMGRTIALANKETLVMAGELITRAAEKSGAKLIPVDSEHSAIFQCLLGERSENVKRIILTGSGGPFFTRQENRFDEITVEEALSHPNWKMGPKITVDSATMMNKGLEIIEAFWLFGLPLQKIDVVIHPQSIIHSLVEFVDGSLKAQLGWPDMRIPIQFALTYPLRKKLQTKKLDFADLKQLTFFHPDSQKFPNLRLAVEALKMGGTAPAILNAANEAAVQKFLAREIRFTAIPELIETALSRRPVRKNPTLDDILQEDRWAREFVRNAVQSGKVAFEKK